MKKAFSELITDGPCKLDDRPYAFVYTQNGAGQKTGYCRHFEWQERPCSMEPQVQQGTLRAHILNVAHR